jgi:hypothetical protein
VIRHAHIEKLVDLTPETSCLKHIIYTNMPLVKLKAALKHFDNTIRLVGFQTIWPVIAVAGQEVLPTIDLEIDLWRESFPYASVPEGKEYMSSLLQCVTVSLDRISNEESGLLDDTADEGDAGSVVRLPRLFSFAVDFLIFEVALRRAGYPGSTGQKEAFAIEVLECINAFASRDPRFVSKNVAVYERKRRTSEVDAATKIIEAMLCRECVATMFSLMHSPWDGVRSTSFRLLSRLVLVGHANNIDLSAEFTSAANRSSMLARGVFLASSPRQRESDAGARLLAFLHFSLEDKGSRWDYIREIVTLLRKRLEGMKVKLARLLSGMTSPQSDDGGTRLPLAHGLVLALQLMIGHTCKTTRTSNPKSTQICEEMALLFCRAIQVSLTVVADVKDDTIIEGMDEGLFNETQDGDNEGTPLNINTGAIGANGTFSSVNPPQKEEHERRIAIQRVVVSFSICQPVNFTVSCFCCSSLCICGLVNLRWDHGC